MTRARPIIAIDGPVGAGKSTVARELARALGFSYINTGAMYRAVALVARERGISSGDAQIEQRLAGILDMIALSFDGERVFLSDRDITSAITAPEVGDLASRLSTLAVVRQKMRDLQRDAARDGNVVMEGRDIGTAVFPDAEFKFFLDADVEVRTERRWREMVAKGASVTRDEVLAQLLERDRRDSERELAPLRRADDAIVIDSTRLAVAEVVAAMKARVEAASHALKGLKPT
jgi:cytidylate kinase